MPQKSTALFRGRKTEIEPHPCHLNPRRTKRESSLPQTARLHQTTQKTKEIRIDQDVVLRPSDLPPDAVLEGYLDFVVQDLVIKTINTRVARQ